ncbi:DUF1667 domain-containing protein [Lancefieldella sp. Marseille-Q7238]|uniref:DUF1667 domain-containing protein n=1 Tax=Lancefieldella sp. Marseille-Q7238 TaxID=3022127 RepID=UPI0024A8D437|nr:DUF1667 domain-containing protein [Lancefieldella sp. Marseille-Q7238]
MPSTQTVTCIRCPRGCSVVVRFDGEKIVEVTGNACPRGDSYARAEVTHPVRTVTTTVPVEDGIIAMVSVKTSVEVPKDKVFDVVKEISHLKARAPVALGDVLLAHAAGTDADIIATKSVSRAEL